MTALPIFGPGFLDQAATPAEHLNRLLYLCETTADMEAFREDFNAHARLLTRHEHAALFRQTVGRFLKVAMREAGRL